MSFELIIFDCDGVLLDSEHIANEVWSDCLSSIGIELSFKETVKLFKRASAVDSLNIVKNKFQRNASEDLISSCVFIHRN